MQDNSTTSQEFPLPHHSEALLQPKEAAALLNISARGLFNLRKRGAIRAFKVGKLVRYRRSDVEAAVTSDTLPLDK